MVRNVERFISSGITVVGVTLGNAWGVPILGSRELVDEGDSERYERDLWNAIWSSFLRQNEQNFQNFSGGGKYAVECESLGEPLTANRTNYANLVRGWDWSCVPWRELELRGDMDRDE